MSEMEWRDISSAPRDVSILVWWRDEAYVARWYDGYNEWGVSVRPINDNEVRTFRRIGPVVWKNRVFEPGPTHWMPLPSPPRPKDVTECIVIGSEAGKMKLRRVYRAETHHRADE